MKRLLPLAVLFALSSAGPAQAGLFGDSEARRQIDDLRQEINARFDRLEAGSRGQLDLANQNEMLRSEIAKLRGQLEVLLHEVETLKQRQRDFYVDLDDRIRRVEGGSPGMGGVAGMMGGTTAPPGDPAAESADYETALNLLKEGKYKEAFSGFETFIARHPGSSFLPGAHFWAGNAALQAKEVATASNYFNTVLSSWPNDPVAPDAMLGLANSQQAMGDARTGQETLRGVIERYPNSSAAQVARQRLGLRP